MLFQTFSLRTFFAFASLVVPLTAAAQPVCEIPALAELPTSPVAIEPSGHAVVSIDANQDAFPDLAWVSLDSAPLAGDPVSLWVSLADGAGGYGPPVEELTLPPYAAWPVVGDVNQDGTDDIVIFPYSSSARNFWTALGDGAGGFSLVTAGVMGNPTFDFSLVNLNDDSLPDLVIPTSGSGQYIGQGDGTFLGLGPLDVNFLRSSRLGLVDLNSDGITDFAGTYASSLRFYLSLGGQAFQTEMTIPVALEDKSNVFLTAAVGGYFNTDPDVDLASFSDGYLHIWLGDGAGNFTARSYPFATEGIYGTQSLTVSGQEAADIDGDGLTEILLYNSESKQWVAVSTAPDGAYEGETEAVTSVGSGRLLSLASLDGDSKPDLLVQEFSGFLLDMYRNTCPLQLTSSFAPNPGFAGDPIDYQFTVRNVGDQPTAALDWTLAAPPEVLLVGSTPSAGSCATATSCTIGPLDPGAAVQIDVSAQLAADAEGFTGPTATVAGAGVGPFSWRARHWSTVRASGPVPSRLGVFHDGQWFIDRDGDTQFDPASEVSGWGSSADIPVEGDWNGDGYRDLGVFSRGIWYRDLNGDGEFDPTTEQQGWGLNTWTPVVGDWNGDGKSDLGVVEPATMTWFRDLNGDGVFDPSTEATVWGSPGNKPVVGDWDGDGDDDLGVFASSIWFRDLNGDGVFDPATEIEGWGTNGSIPAVGDWNGDGATDLGVYADGIWFRDLDGNGAFDPATEISGWGMAFFQPIVEDWDGDGDDDLAIYADGLWFADFNGDGVFDPNTEFRGWGSLGWSAAAGPWK